MTMLKYKDLIQFEAVESVVQLREANNNDYAISLINSYVISDNMAERMTNEIIENMQFDRATNSKGTLIVGNYGTGKSHLMSVISTIAELPGASNHLRNENVAEKAKEIEGKFKVIRAEFGAVTMSLREIICQEVERGLEKIGIDYTFPPADKVTNNKDMFYEMMELFHEKYPDQGLLLVIDELLDYLRSRKEQELTLDLGFLREIGEVCSKSRFRFISGVQEMLFDNPRFSYVAESLRRVKERFSEVRIVREDIAYVVSERLLKKNEEQKALIREHLGKFTKLYNGLSENMETYVNMFPIHPAYLEVFEKVNIAEKRVALQTISTEIKKLIDTEVPEESTGLISFDRYWDYIVQDTSLRSEDNVKVVMNKVETLKGTVQNSMKTQYKEMGLQLIKALAVHRLTTDELKTPIGLTSETLRDKLFLSMPMLLELDDEAADMLTTTIEVVMRDLMIGASYQFISLNKDNSQYYIDIDKVTAVDELIEQRGESLDDHMLDRYYFQILKQATEVSDNTYVMGYKIWKHEIPWEDRRIKRSGYLFFGAPNERSTAQPERDFYIYMLPPFEEPKYTDELKEDEVFFRLKKKDHAFINLLRLYGGACEMYNDTSTNKHLYAPKREQYLKKIIKWLKESFVDAFEIIYRGKHENVLGHGMFLPHTDTLIDVIDAVSENLLSQWFESKYSEYPSFRKLEQSYITSENISTYVNDALAYLVGKKTNQGKAILDGLILLDENEKLTTAKSGYVKWVLELLNEKPSGQVLNNNELIETINTVHGSEDQRIARRFQLEPELIVVLLAALIQSGEIVVTVEGKTYEAMNINEFINLSFNDLTHFSHIKKPIGMPVHEVQSLIRMLKLEMPNFSKQSSLDFAIKDTISKAKVETDRTVEMIEKVKHGFMTWDGPLFTEIEKTKKIEKLESLSEFLQGIQVYNTSAKMMNFKYDVARIEKEQTSLEIVNKLNSLEININEYMKTANYLMQAKRITEPYQGWIVNVDDTLHKLGEALKNEEDCVKETMELARLKKVYSEHYLELHQKARLNATENKRKSDLLKGPQAEGLRTIASGIDFLPTQGFDEWQLNIHSLKDCYSLTPDKLEHTPECKVCKFNPSEEHKSNKSLSELEDWLNEILESWTDTLLTNFNDEDVKSSIEYLEPKSKELITDLISKESFTLPISKDLINTINTVLKGIKKESIDSVQINKVLGDGNPITVEEARRNFEMLLKGLVGNNNSSNVRLIIKK